MHRNVMVNLKLKTMLKIIIFLDSLKKNRQNNNSHFSFCEIKWQFIVNLHRIRINSTNNAAAAFKMRVFAAPFSTSYWLHISRVWDITIQIIMSLLYN